MNRPGPKGVTHVIVWATSATKAEARTTITAIRVWRDRVPLTVCPLSNVKLRVFDKAADHHLVRLLDAGLVVTVNSDDPAYFGGYVNDNFIQMFEALPLGREHAYQMAHNSFSASFLGEAEKRKYLDEVDAFFGR